MDETRDTRGVPQEARSELTGAADEVRAGAAEAARAGRERARSLFEEQKEAAAGRVHGFADALRTTARKLDEEGAGASGVTKRAADGLDRLASSLRERDFESFLHEAEGFARRSPALFVGGTVTAGFLLARFLKSSGERARARGDGIGEIRPLRRPAARRPGAAPMGGPDPRTGTTTTPGRPIPGTSASQSAPGGRAGSPGTRA